jgi:TRAP-type C4-dicarboxylate transport system permease small subunit
VGRSNLFACVVYVLYAKTLPPDELVMANTLEFQAIMSFIFVALPSGFCLLFFLAVGALVKGRAAGRRRGKGHAFDIGKNHICIATARNRLYPPAKGTRIRMGC